MSIENLRKRILEDDAFVLSEILKVRYLYKLKKEIRFALSREGSVHTESVAEHIYGMHVIAHYFLPLEDTQNEWDRTKIFEMITWHDMDEIETGDIVSHHKTEEHIRAAEEALPKVIANLPAHLQAHVSALMDEYEARVTPEARFVKAIDKAEPIFEVWEECYKNILHKNQNTLDNHWETKRKYVENFPYIMRFVEVATKRLEREGFFIEAA